MRSSSGVPVIRLPRKPGVPGLAVLTATVGMYLVYVGIKKVPFTTGLKSLLRGENPASLAQAKATGGITVGGTGTGTPGEVNIKNPVPMSETALARNGIRVHKSIVAQTNSMIDAAKADGISLAGGGWRSSATQAALRIKNGCTCKDSSSCCKIPTAPVGKSMHERGLAIDFNGIKEHSDPRWQWLNKHAAKYGFKNLESEPWHWSTTGD